MLVFIAFPIAVIRYSDKSNIKENRSMVAHNSRYSPPWQESHGTCHNQDRGVKESWQSAHCLHFLQFRIPNSGNGLPHNQDVSSHINLYNQDNLPQAYPHDSGLCHVGN